YGNGMMAKVIRPDNTEVTFKYDSLGRRIEKSSDDKTMNFVWDGNTILHEYFMEDNSDEFENLVEHSSQINSEIPDNIVTWVFNDGFIPSAKITNEGNYSIISDYLGTPVEAYDQEGNKVWSAELDIYGRVNEFTGEKDFIPFRYQGQYEDVEIGLFYNRFRYYDPEQGNYTQIDPIGLAGGNPPLYGYVYNPTIEIDPFGLAFGKKMPKKGWNYGNMPKPKIYQLHHIIPKSLRKHEAIVKSGMSINDIKNLIYLPIDRQYHPTRSIHDGYNSYHADYNRLMKEELNRIALEGKGAKNWTQQQYRDEVEKLIRDTRKDLRNGKIKVHCKG
ncbi:AHH domain-containing protein, partial [Lysinibacillus xylanilyticus]|uniref:AHH domain-containing protein n=1 Tax=Lysinibacillus xylanilyticus TaxID=582475 RepID=UPI003CFF292B